MNISHLHASHGIERLWIQRSSALAGIPKKAAINKAEPSFPAKPDLKVCPNIVRRSVLLDPSGLANVDQNRSIVD
jgi:hypothetical protein